MNDEKFAIMSKFNKIIKAIVSKLNYIMKSPTSELMVTHVDIVIRNTPNFLIENNEKAWRHNDLLLQIKKGDVYNWGILNTIDFGQETSIDGSKLEDDIISMMENVRSVILSVSETERILIFKDVIELYRQMALFRKLN
uniref:Uncharacterized protein n=1 Tax=viral metagenome TaxID=1070528 RepID=A0A6C0BBH7_9ZZZZ